LRVLDLVGREIVWCPPNSTLKEVVHKMRAHNVGSVLILNGDELVGIFTERDLVRAFDEGAKPEDLVSDFMTRNPIVVNPEESLESALQKMLAHGIRHLPVVSPEGRVLGVVSLRDVVEALLAQQTPI